VKTFFYWVMLLTFSVNAQARLNIEITRGMAGGVPIAVMTSLKENQGDARVHGSGASFEDLAGVIRNDLKMCGRFEPLYPEQLPRLSSVQQESEPGVWQAAGAENVVLGDIQPTGDNRFTVTFHLTDVYHAPKSAPAAAAAPGAPQPDQVRLASNNVLTSKTFQGVRRENFRALAHHISDIIYERLTGIRGAFSTRIAYVMVVKSAANPRYSLEVADADGFNPRTLVKSSQPLMSPSWSPDARWLSFVSFEKNRAEIYLMEVATGRRQLLSKFPGINGAPAWSPDGRTLAMVLSKGGSPKLYLMNVATRGLVQLTDGLSIDTEPAWSKDGQSLYFTSNRGGKPQIYRMNMASRKVDRVTFTGNYNARPMLTPDGKYLIMMHRDDQEGNFHIASQELTTGQVSVLTHARLDESPTLSPNGAMVLYGTQDGDRQILGLVTLDGRGQLRFPAREGSVQEPAWSPFLL
jgi:TolB protein